MWLYNIYQHSGKKRLLRKQMWKENEDFFRVWKMQFLLLMPPRSSRYNTIRHALAGPSCWLLTAVKPSQIPHLGYLELKHALQLSASIIIRQRMFCVFPLKSVCVGSFQSVHEPGAEVFVSGVLIQPWTDWLRSYYVPTETSRLPFASSPYFLKNYTHLFDAYRHHFPEIPHIYRVPNWTQCLSLQAIPPAKLPFSDGTIFYPDQKPGIQALLLLLSHLASLQWPYFVISTSIQGLRKAPACPRPFFKDWNPSIPVGKESECHTPQMPLCPPLQPLPPEPVTKR